MPGLASWCPIAASTLSRRAGRAEVIGPVVGLAADVGAACAARRPSRSRRPRCRRGRPARRRLPKKTRSPGSQRLPGREERAGVVLGLCGARQARCRPRGRRPGRAPSSRSRRRPRRPTGTACRPGERVGDRSGAAGAARGRELPRAPTRRRSCRPPPSRAPRSRTSRRGCSRRAPRAVSPGAPFAASSAAAASIASRGSRMLGVGARRGPAVGGEGGGLELHRPDRAGGVGLVDAPGSRPWSDSTLPTAASSSQGSPKRDGRLLVERRGRRRGCRRARPRSAAPARRRARPRARAPAAEQQPGGRRAARSRLPRRRARRGRSSPRRARLGLASTCSGKRSSPTTKRPCPRGAAEEVAGLPLGQPEGGGDPVDRLRRLAEQDLAGGVRDDRVADLGREQVAGILGDRRQPAPALARALGEPVEKGWRRPARASRARPRRRARSAAGARDSSAPPDRVEAEEERGRLQPLGEAAQREADELRPPGGRSSGGEERESEPGRCRGSSRSASACALGRAAAQLVAARSRRSGGAPAGARGVARRGRPGRARRARRPRGRRRAARRARRGRRAARRPRRGRRSPALERVERHRLRPGQRQVGAADRLAEPPVLVLGVDDEDLDAPVERGAAPRASPDSSCRRPSGRGRRCCSCRRRSGRRRPGAPGRREPVEAAALGQRGSASANGNARRERVAVERAPQPSRSSPSGRLDAASPRRPGSSPGMQREELGGAECAQPLGGLGQLRARSHRLDGEVEPGAEEAALAAHEPVGEVVGVLGRGGDRKVVEAAALGLEPPGRLEAGALAAQARGGELGRERLDVQREVAGGAAGEERCEPAVADLARVAADREGLAQAPAEAHPVAAELEGGRGEQAALSAGMHGGSSPPPGASRRPGRERRAHRQGAPPPPRRRAA